MDVFCCVGLFSQEKCLASDDLNSTCTSNANDMLDEITGWFVWLGRNHIAGWPVMIRYWFYEDIGGIFTCERNARTNFLCTISSIIVWFVSDMLKRLASRRYLMFWCLPYFHGLFHTTRIDTSKINNDVNHNLSRIIPCTVVCLEGCDTCKMEKTNPTLC